MHMSDVLPLRPMLAKKNRTNCTRAHPLQTKLITSSTSFKQIWAFGCVAYEILFGGSPFDRGTQPQTVHSILRDNLVFPPDKAHMISSEAKEMISACLIKDAKLRPTARQLLGYDFFKTNAQRYASGCAPPFEK